MKSTSLSPALRTVASGLLVALASCSAESPDLGAQDVPRLVRDLVAQAPAFEESRGPAPRALVISPARSLWRDGADMPSLVLPPPAEATFLAPAEAPTLLRGRVGIDASAHAGLSDAAPRAAVAFEVEVDGRLLFERKVELTREHAAGRFGTDWVDLAGEGGADLELPAGARVTLRTRAFDAEDNEVDPGVELLAGFGGLRLERDRALPRLPSSPEAPNVVLVVMDTLRVDRLSTYGYGKPTAPSLDALAARGVSHARAQSTSSWTWPSTASILTGLQTPEHGVVGDGSSFLPRQIDTLAEVLRARGFTTAAWSGNPLVAPSRNFDQGFERFTVEPAGFTKTGAFFGEVEAWLDDNAGRRFFLYLHLVDPHGPLQALPESKALLAPEVPDDFEPRLTATSKPLGRGDALQPDGTFDLGPFLTPEEVGWTRSLDDACVHSGDVWLGRVLARLQALGLDDETVVLFTSDHGEELLERGILGHHHSLHQELVHVPLVVAGPGVPSGVTRSAPLSNRLVAPALARLAGAPWPGGEEALDTLLGRTEPVGPVLFATEKGWWQGENGRTLLGLREGDLILHWAPETKRLPGGPPQDPEPGTARLYDLSNDPLERRDLASERASEVERLRRQLFARRAELAARAPAATFGAGSATLEVLQRVGYTGGDH